MPPSATPPGLIRAAVKEKVRAGPPGFGLGSDCYLPLDSAPPLVAIVFNGLAFGIGARLCRPESPGVAKNAAQVSGLAKPFPGGISGHEKRPVRTGGLQQSHAFEHHPGQQTARGICDEQHAVGEARMAMAEIFGEPGQLCIVGVAHEKRCTAGEQMIRSPAISRMACTMSANPRTARLGGTAPFRKRGP
jgi:hypothetical protein